jgi:hypothetical protein
MIRTTLRAEGKSRCGRDVPNLPHAPPTHFPYDSKVFRCASFLVLFNVCFFGLRSTATVALAYLSNSFHASLDLYDHKLLYVADS